MASEFGVLSVLPAVLSIALALYTKRAIPALLFGVLSANVILSTPHFSLFPIRAIDHVVEVAANADNFALILFSVSVGALLKLMRAGRGFEAVALFIERHRAGYGRRTAFGLNFVLGAALFIETYSNVLIAGTTLGPIYDRLRISRQRLAYFTHTIGITVVSMILVNTWGAFYIGLLSSQGVTEPFDFAVASIPYMLYGWCSLGLIILVMVTGLSIGPMRTAERSTPEQRGAVAVADLTAQHPGEAPDGARPRLSFFLIPIGLLLSTLTAGLYFTGEGDLTRGDGAAAGVYAVFAAILAAAVLAAVQGRLGLAMIEAKMIAGMREFFDVAILIVLALTIGAACRDLSTGPYIAQLVGDYLPVAVLPALVFATGAAMSFATGTSYGTFSILTPIALPLATAMHLDPALLFGACIAGGVFGDNCSPISDTSIVASMGAGVTVMEHVQTQLPYALIAAGMAAVGYLALGFAS